MTALQFWQEHVYPFCNAHGIEALFIRAKLKDGTEMLSVLEVLRQAASRRDAEFDDMVSGISVPLFTNDRSRGRLRQSCTDKWKVRAINQEAKRRGIGTLRNAIGFHAGECHRIKARYLKDDGGFSIYKPQHTRKGISKDIRWLEHYYPCIDLGLDREKIRSILQKRGIQYLVTTECDWCPHQDYARWIMHTQEVIDEAADVEAMFNGKLFFTALRIPLKQALKVMGAKKESQTEMSFGCENGAYCGI